MNSIGKRHARVLNPILAAIYGAVVALGAAYVLSYVFAHFGVGVLTAPETSGSDPASSDSPGAGVFGRAILNIYAAQHVTLVGQGNVASTVEAGPPAVLSSSITLPVTLWTAIPALALMLGGYAAARWRAGTGRWGTLLPAIGTGAVYALALAALSVVVRARVGSFVMPEISGFSANPPPLLFRPEMASTVVFAGGFGLMFAYLGGLIAVRSEDRDPAPGRWWAAVKAAVLLGLVVQVLMVTAVGIWLASGTRRADDRPQDQRITEMVPAAAGIAYAMANGAALRASVESHIRRERISRKTLDVRMSLYEGLVQEEPGETSRKPAPLSVTIPAAALTALGFVLAGLLAVRWGSRGGSLPTAVRIATAHTAYLAVLAVLCTIELVQADPLTVSTIALRPTIDWRVLFSFAAVLMLSLVGAHLANRRLVGFRIHSA